MKQILKHSLVPLLPPLAFILVGLATAFTAVTYEIGTFTRMGPGFVPMVLGSILILLGGLTLCRDRQSEPQTGIALRPFIAVTTGILFWALLVEFAGFLPGSAGLVLLTSLALPHTRWHSVLILATVLSVAGYLLFVLQLGVPLNAVG